MAFVYAQFVERRSIEDTLMSMVKESMMALQNHYMKVKYLQSLIMKIGKCTIRAYLMKKKNSNDYISKIRKSSYMH